MAAKYECDKLLGFNYSLFEARCTYEGYLVVSLANIDDIQGAFKKGISDNYNSTVFSQEIERNHDVNFIKKVLT